MTIVRNGTITGGDVTIISVASNAGASFSIPNIYAPDLTRTIVNNFGEAEVVNVDGAAPIYFRTDDEDPSVAGDDCHVVPGAGQSLKVPISGDEAVVRLIASIDTDYSVEFR